MRESQYDAAILPWSATEAHNLHLPCRTDVYKSDSVAAEAARLAWERGTRPLATPEKGAVFFQLVTEKIAGYLTELAGANPNDRL